MRLIKVGTSSQKGDLYKKYDEAKSCNLCKHFQGYGLHWCAGKCIEKNIEIEGGYTGNYRKTAEECESFDCRLEFLAELL